MSGRRCGVLGSPISHSLSPTLHRAAYGELGLDWEYDAHEVDEAGLPAFLAGLGADWRGLSLTMPLKHVAVGLCTSVDDQARLVEAVNTVLVEGARTLVGTNTDVPGFVAAWRAAGIGMVRRAAVLGAGATARSAVAALAEIGARDVVVVARSREKAATVASLAGALGLSASVLGMLGVPEGVDLLVSTLPAGALAGETSALVYGLVAGADAVCDVVYQPRLTPLVSAARRAGLPCAEGFDLLLHQAALQVELMTECRPAPVETMRQAGLAELARREGVS